MSISPKTRNTLIIGGIVAALALALYVLPSIFLRDFARDTLADYGLYARGLDEVSFNPYRLSLETGPLVLESTAGQVVSVDSIGLYFRFTPFAKKRIHVSGLEISGLALTLTKGGDGAYTVAGLPDITPPPTTEPAGVDESTGTHESNWLLGLDIVAITESRATVDLPELAGTLAIDRLTLTNFKAWSPTTPGRFSFKGAFNDGDIDLEGSVTAFADTRAGAVAIALDDVPLDGLRLGTGLRGAMSADLDIAFEAGADGSLTAAVSGEATVNDMVLLPEGGEEIALGEIDLSAFKSEFSSRPDVEPAFAGSGTLALEDLRAGTADAPLALLDTLEIPEWAISREGRFTAATLTARDGRLGPNEDQSEDRDLMRFAEVRVSNLTAATNGASLAAGLIEIEGLVGQIARTADGIAFPPELTAGGADETETKQSENEENETSPPLPAITVGTIRVVGDSGFSFAERSLHLPADFNIALKTFEVRDIDSTKPDAPARITLDALINEFAEVKANATVQPFRADGISFDMTGNVTGLDLPRLSPYAATFLGVNLETGQLNADITARADKSVLDSVVDLNLLELKVSPLEDFDKTSLEEQIDMPIKTALDLVRNRKGEINLKVPVTGPLGDPAFDMSNAVSKAIGSALTGAVTTTLKIMFPVAGLASLLIDAGVDGGPALKLQPVLFDAGGIAPKADQLDLINRLGTLMTERPGVRVRLCGRATSADFATLRPAPAEPAEAPEPAPQPEPTPEERTLLLEQAAERARVVKRFLIASHDLAAERILECRPVFDPVDQDPPRVAIRL